MAVIHIKEADGGAKCGCNVYIRHEWDDKGNVIKTERRISSRQFLYFATDGRPATCKRCLNKINRPETNRLDGNHIGRVFHRSFGYDMTINVYAKCIKQTPKSLVCQECNTVIASGDPWGPSGNGKAIAGEIKEDSKPFNMFNKAHNNYNYWTGAGEHWSEWDGQANYENHCD